MMKQKFIILIKIKDMYFYTYPYLFEKKYKKCYNIKYNSLYLVNNKMVKYYKIGGKYERICNYN